MGVVTLPNLDCNEQFKTWVQATVGRYLLTGAGASAQSRKKDFPVRKDSSHGYFFLINGHEESKPHVWKGSHHFLFHPLAIPCEPTVPLTLEPVVLPPLSVFGEHGYLQHVGAEYSGQVNLQFRLYFVPEDLVLSSFTWFAYKKSIKIADNADPKVDPARGELVSISVVVPEA